MRAFGLILRRELGAIFTSVWTWALLAIVSAIIAWGFRTSLFYSGFDVTQALRNVYGWTFFITIVLAPLITSWLYVEDKRTGSLELMMTAPVRDSTVVLAKLAAATVYFAAFVAPLWGICSVLALFFGTSPDWGQLFAMTAGLLALGELFLAVGSLASALASTHLYAALLAILGNMLLLAPGGIARLLDPDSKLYAVFTYADFDEHLRTAAVGLLDVRHLVLELSVAALLVFWTIRIVETRRWL
jgi:ABC-2 type transport system permease protein